MIQRIQSLYLLFVLLLNAFALWMPWATYHLTNEAFMLSGADLTYDGVSSTPLTIALMLSMALTLLCIFLFKRRPQQMKMINITMIQQLVVLGMFSWVHYQVIEQLKITDTNLDIGYGVSVVVPLISLVLCWLAKKGVKKDEDLIRSVDRLR